ncbi:MAG: late competence development ComFB family protein [Treponema sp.]|nr:late competence development ComFB family protein [Treponema sp.]MCL2236991.1 late competence development ComFB family protein [Treponema sp.]
MAFKDDYDFNLLKNEAEVLVIREMEHQIGAQAGNMCRCNECIVDIAAISLNSVKPLYRFSILGTQYASQAMTEQTYADSVKKAVKEAIVKVRKNPAHD